MPVVEETSNLYRDYLNGETGPENVEASATLYHATGTVENAADDLQGSTYKLCSIPADAIIDPKTFFDVENWGYADIRIGTLSDADALVSQTRGSAAMVTPVETGDANHGLRLWQILGLAENPGGEIDLYAHGSQANATGAGAMPFQVAYLWN